MSISIMKRAALFSGFMKGWREFVTGWRAFKTGCAELNKTKYAENFFRFVALAIWLYFAAALLGFAEASEEGPAFGYNSVEECNAALQAAGYERPLQYLVSTRDS